MDNRSQLQAELRRIGDDNKKTVVIIELPEKHMIAFQQTAERLNSSLGDIISLAAIFVYETAELAVHYHAPEVFIQHMRDLFPFVEDLERQRDGTPK